MQLTYPFFLLGLLAIAVPIIIHLLRLRKPQRLFFTNTALIREVELVTVRQRKIQNVWVLLARVLAIAALIFAFCQPFIPAAQNRSDSISSEVAVFVDNSNSMQLGSAAQGSLFERAVEGARSLSEAKSSARKVRLINGKRVSGVMTQASFQASLDELRLSAQAPIIASAVETGEDRRKSPLYIFSDFQRNSVNRQFIDKLGTRQEAVLVPLVGKPAGNVYVDSVWLNDAFVRVRTNVGLHVRLHNGGSLVTTNCPVKVYLGNRQVAAFRVTVEPGQTTTSVVQVQVGDNVLALGRVVTEDTPVTFDNTYYFTMQPVGAIRVLEIGSEPVAQQLYGNEPLFTYSFSKPQNLDYGLLRQANLVVVREVGTVDAGLRDGLKAVLKRGGSVVVVPSAVATGQASYQQLFRDLGLGTVQWEGKTATPELREVAMPNAQEPFFRNVFGAQQRAVTMPRAAPVLRWSRTQTDILRLRDGESYLADFVSGAGHVYVFSAPFARAYSDFTAHALFVPVMYRMAMLSYQNEQLPAYRLTQPTVALKLPVDARAADGPNGKNDEASFRLVKDSLTLIPAQRVLGQEILLDMPEGMNEPGFYQVQQRGKVLTTLAFNQDKRESELAAYSADDLRKLIGPNHPNIKVVENGVDGASLAKFEAEQTGQPLWRYFLALGLACLLAEALLIRFGNRRVVANPVKMAV